MIDLTGITNENEFYTHHYLSAILEEDLKKLYKEWAKAEKEGKEKAPYSVLAGSAKKVITLSNQLSQEKSEDFSETRLIAGGSSTDKRVAITMDNAHSFEHCWQTAGIY